MKTSLSILFLAGASVLFSTCGHAQSLEAYLTSAQNREASWYVSTDVSTHNTTILFMDKNRQVIYHEILPQQYVELTSHNRRYLDQMLSRMTNKVLLGNGLKTTPMPTNVQNSGLPIVEYTGEAASNSLMSPTGLTTSVKIVNCKMVRAWWSGIDPEKVTFRVASSMGRTLHLTTVKSKDYADVFPVLHLREGVYEVSVAGKTWEKKYEFRITRDRGKMECDLQPR